MKSLKKSPAFASPDPGHESPLKSTFSETLALRARKIEIGTMAGNFTL